MFVELRINGRFKALYYTYSLARCKFQNISIRDNFYCDAEISILIGV